MDTSLLHALILGLVEGVTEFLPGAFVKKIQASVATGVQAAFLVGSIVVRTAIPRRRTGSAGSLTLPLKSAPRILKPAARACGGLAMRGAARRRGSRGPEVADRFAYRSAVTLWEKMGRLGGTPPEFLSTHPSPQHRAARRREPFRGWPARAAFSVAR